MTDTKKKMTIGGFFRAGLRWALGGGIGENPVTTVLKEGIKAQKEDDGKTVIDTTIDEESDHGRKEKAS